MTRPWADPSHLVEVERCALCGGTSSEERVREDPFRVVRCTACGLCYVTPRLSDDDLMEVYAADYWDSDSPKERGYADYRGQEQNYRKTFEKRAELVDAHTSGPGRALDIGCAAGFFLEVLIDRGWEVMGVEPSAEIAEHGRRRLGADRVHIGDLESAELEPASFDLVTLWDVVEHLTDPVATLQAAAALLAPGGILILETQNIDSRFARLLGSRWHHFKHLEHLYHFTPATVAALLDRAGLRVTRLTPKYGGKHVSIAFVRERAARLGRGVALALRPLAPLDDVSLYVNLHDEMVVVAER